MTRRNSILAYPLLISLGFLGAWLIGLLGDERREDVSGVQLLMSIFGFLIFLGALLGLIYLIGRQRRPIDYRELLLWEEERRKGRALYIKHAVLKGFLLGIISSSLSVLFAVDRGSFGSLQFVVFIFLVLVIVFACYYAAVRTWDAHEKAYLLISRHQSHPKS